MKILRTLRYFGVPACGRGPAVVYDASYISDHKQLHVKQQFPFLEEKNKTKSQQQSSSAFENCKYGINE